MFQKLLFSVLIAAPAISHAYKGSVSFSASERQNHRAQIYKFVQIGENCLNDYRESHLSFYRANCRSVGGRKVCLSKYFGDRRYSTTRGAHRSDGEALTYLGDALQAAGFPTSYMSKMENISCVGMAVACLRKAFTQTGQSAQWKKIWDFTRKNGVGGTALQEALRKIGWTIYYWNPETSTETMREWDREEMSWRSKGWHVARYNSVMNKGTYWLNKVDDSRSMVGFGKGTPQILRSLPFWIGTAHAGYHVFPGTYTNVVEAHSTRHITSRDNLEFSQFAPMATGGGPRWTPNEKYRNGLIAAPPL